MLTCQCGLKRSVHQRVDSTSRTLGTRVLLITTLAQLCCVHPSASAKTLSLRTTLTMAYRTSGNWWDFGIRLLHSFVAVASVTLAVYAALLWVLTIRSVIGIVIVQIGQTKFLTGKFEKPRPAEAGTEELAVPALYLTFAIDQLEGEQLKARYLRGDWLYQQVKSNPQVVKHEWNARPGNPEKQDLLLTESTPELRAFVLSQLGKRDAWMPITFKKIRQSMKRFGAIDSRLSLLGCEFIIVAFRSAKVRRVNTLLRSKRRQTSAPCE